MRLQALVGTAALAVVFVATAAAADVTGKWTAQVPTRGGEMREATFNFKVDGDKLAGTMSGPRGEIEISDGKVSGDDISFSVNLSFNGNDIKLLYKGKVNGDEIKFTREREGGGRTQEFTAKRLPT